MNQELEKKLIDDLQKTGFISEMKVAKIFHSLGWKIGLNNGYFDRDENITREIDLSSYHFANLKYQNSICVYSRFHVIAEIKKTKEPWIVFRHYPDSMYQSCAWNNVTTSINLPEHPAKLAKFLGKSSLLRTQGWIGKGIHQAFKDPSMPSRWYQAFASVCKATEHECEANASDGERVSLNVLEKPTEFSFFQPVVILDGILIAANLSNSGDVVLEEVESAPFNFEFRTKNYNRGSYRVDLVTINGLESYLNLVKQRHEDILTGFRQYISYPLEKES